MQKASDYRRIARLGDAWGRRLDALGVCFRMLRWLAGASASRYAVERDARYRSLVKMLEDTAPGEERRVAFEALMAAHPKLGASGKRAEVRSRLRAKAAAQLRDGGMFAPANEAT